MLKMGLAERAPAISTAEGIKACLMVAAAAAAVVAVAYVAVRDIAQY